MKSVKNIVIRGASKVSVAAGTAGALLFGMHNPVVAAEDESVLPSFIEDILEKFGYNPSTGSIEGSTARTYIDDRIRIGLTILFILVFIVAIIYSALAAIKFMSSQGESGKYEESKGAVKAIGMGFAAMIISIVGIFVILWVLGAESGPESTLPEELDTL